VNKASPKVAVRCDSHLLQRSLEIFLAPYLAPDGEADILVTDRDGESASPLLRVGTDRNQADLVVPFTRSQLMLRLEKIAKDVKDRSAIHALDDEEEETLQREIERITQAFVKELVDVVKAHCKA